jgi:hypothetical protein
MAKNKKEILRKIIVKQYGVNGEKQKGNFEKSL